MQCEYVCLWYYFSPFYQFSCVVVWSRQRNSGLQLFKVALFMTSKLDFEDFSREDERSMQFIISARWFELIVFIVLRRKLLEFPSSSTKCNHASAVETTDSRAKLIKMSWLMFSFIFNNPHNCSLSLVINLNLIIKFHYIG